MAELIKHKVKIGAITAYYWANQLETGRPSLIMVHGFRGDHHGMLKIAAKLGANYNLFVPDLPGFGQTPALQGRAHNLALYTEFLRSFIESLKLGAKPHLLAHSFGATIASAFAVDHGNTIGKLVLLSPIAARPLPTVLSAVTKPAMSLLRILPDRLGRLLTGTNLATDLVSLGTTTTKDRELRHWIKAEHRRYFNDFATHRSMVEAMQASNTHHVAQFALSIANQTLVITGDKDRIGKSKRQAALHQVFPNAAVKIIPGVGHLTHYETPNQVAQFVKEFI